MTSALTWQACKDEAGAVQGVFVGAEARYIAGFSGLTLNFRVGEAVFAGPTLAIAFKGGSMLNLAWSPQVWGRALPASSPGAARSRQFRTASVPDQVRHAVIGTACSPRCYRSDLRCAHPGYEENLKLAVQYFLMSVTSDEGSGT